MLYCTKKREIGTLQALSRRSFTKLNQQYDRLTELSLDVAENLDEIESVEKKMKC